MSTIDLAFAGHNPAIAAYKLTLTNPDGSTVDMGTHAKTDFPMTFDAPTVPGGYVLTCAAVDASGVNTADPVITATFTIDAANIPASLTVTL